MNNCAALSSTKGELTVLLRDFLLNVLTTKSRDVVKKTNYSTDDLTCVSSPITFHHLLSSTLPSRWVGDIINLIKSSLLEKCTCTAELMESGYDLSHFLSKFYTACETELHT